MAKHLTGLKKVDNFNWKKLDRTIDTLAEAINEIVPLEGDGIRIVDTNNGKLISVSHDVKGQDSSGGTQQTATAPHILINSITWHGMKFQAVNVVDPSTCVQSTISVLTYTGSPNDSIEIDFTYNLWADPTQNQLP